MKQVALIVAVLGACTGEGNQIIVELDGPVMARSVELVFADPHVFIKRSQRINMPPIDPASEPAFYVVQRTRLDLVLEGDGLQPVDDIEVQLVNAGGLLPIVIARDEQEAIVGMGVLAPDRVFRDEDGENEDNFALSLEELADVTRYPITVEPTVERNQTGQAGQPVAVASGEARGIRCNNQEGLSGLVWRPLASTDGNSRQLRIAKPLDGSDDALARVELEGFDLDCDSHTPSIRGSLPEGDQADCDDTSERVSGDESRVEACDQIDSDCDASTMGAEVKVASSCGTCLGHQLSCYEATTNTFDANGCVSPSQCRLCPVHVQSNGMGLVGCKNVGELALPGECQDQCVVRLVAVDGRWDVLIGDPGDPAHRLFEGYTPTTQKLAFLIEPKSTSTFTVNDVNFGSFMVAYQPLPTSRVFVIEMVLDADGGTTHIDLGDTCEPLEVMPACGLGG